MRNFLKFIFIFFVLFAFVKECSGPDEKNNNNDSKVDVRQSVPEPTPESFIKIKKTNGQIDDYGFLTVYATLNNTSNKLATYIKFDIVVTDKKGNVIGTGIGNTSNLGSGKTRVVTGIVSDIYEDNITYTTEITTARYN
jgi:hypothetical protein